MPDQEKFAIKVTSEDPKKKKEDGDGDEDKAGSSKQVNGKDGKDSKKDGKDGKKGKDDKEGEELVRPFCFSFVRIDKRMLMRYFLGITVRRRCTTSE